MSYSDYKKELKMLLYEKDYDESILKNNFYESGKICDEMVMKIEKYYSASIEGIRERINDNKKYFKMYVNGPMSRFSTN